MASVVAEDRAPVVANEQSVVAEEQSVVAEEQSVVAKRPPLGAYPPHARRWPLSDRGCRLLQRLATLGMQHVFNNILRFADGCLSTSLSQRTQYRFLLIRRNWRFTLRAAAVLHDYWRFLWRDEPPRGAPCQGLVRDEPCQVCNRLLSWNQSQYIVIMDIPLQRRRHTVPDDADLEVFRCTARYMGSYMCLECTLFVETGTQYRTHVIPRYYFHVQRPLHMHWPHTVPDCLRPLHGGITQSVVAERRVLYGGVVDGGESEGGESEHGESEVPVSDTSEDSVWADRSARIRDYDAVVTELP